MNRCLPASLEDLTGLRAARWFRESTAGQYDNFGPDAQREQQDRALSRYGLLDGGLEWSVASSGWKSAWQTPTWQAMIAAAESGAFDILVVGYVSRFLRNLKQTLIAVEDHLQKAGIAVLFADERLLTSDPNQWDQFVREAHEAEAYSPFKESEGGIRLEASSARRAGWQPGPVRDRPRRPSLDPADRRGEGADRLARLPACRHRSD
jgi:Resolvase, N terminal domain